MHVVGLLIAALGGAAVGLERQRSGHAEGPRAHFAGFRTFTLLGGIGGLSGILWTLGYSAPAIVLLAGALSLITVAYLRASSHDIDGTTEVAAVVVMAAGFMSGIGGYEIASGVIAVTSLLLIEKTRLHEFAARLDDVELRAAVRFAVLALVVLPLLPEGPYGPFGGVRPRLLWALVLFFSGLSFVAYIARRAVGPGRGYLVAGLLGGVASSTNVTYTFARQSRNDTNVDRALAIGAIAGNAMMYPRVLIAVSVLNLPLLLVLWPYILAPALIATAVALIGWRQSMTTSQNSSDATTPGKRPTTEVQNPLQLGAALKTAVVFQVALSGLQLIRRAWGASGVWTSAALLGLTDVDALTVSMARDVAGSASLQVAAAAIAIGTTSNTVLKTGLALILGTAGFRKVAGATLLVMTLAAVASIVLLKH